MRVAITSVKPGPPWASFRSLQDWMDRIVILANRLKLITGQVTKLRMAAWVLSNNREECKQLQEHLTSTSRVY